MQAGQKLSRHIKKEFKEADLERKLAHIEQFGPILVEKLAEIVGANDARKKRAQEGLKKILGRDSKEAISQFEDAVGKLDAQKKKEAKKSGRGEDPSESEVAVIEEVVVASKGKKKASDKKTTGKRA